jgi:hypothetical protein
MALSCNAQTRRECGPRGQECVIRGGPHELPQSFAFASSNAQLGNAADQRNHHVAPD